jgi:ubiquinone/menaquinone biosynthesis C-methylase UbiE
MGRSFDRAAESYDQARGGEERGENFAEEIEPHLQIQTGAVVLEVGVGTGVVAAAMQRRGRRVVGLDIAMKMLRVALGRSTGLVRYDGRRMPFTDSAFDAAYMVWVIHLVDDQRALLREVARVLRPNGRLVIATTDREPDDPVRHITEPMHRSLLGENWPFDDLDRVALAASAAELHEVTRLVGVPFVVETSGDAEAARIVERTSSMFWDLSDRKWTEHVVPAIDRLRALGRVPLTRVRTHEILVLEKS